MRYEILLAGLTSSDAAFHATNKLVDEEGATAATPAKVGG
jgi:hypothetical protein